MATRRVRDPRAFGLEAAQACRRLLDRQPVAVDWPASRSRRSLRVEFSDGSVIATRRRRRERAQLEAHVMRTLHEAGAAVPEVLAFDGTWMLQEYVDGERLPHILTAGDAVRAHRLLDIAAGELAKIHRIGHETGLDGRVVQLGRTDEWLAGFLGTPARIGDAIGVPAPELDTDTLIARLRIDAPTLVKWDARPGNAVARADGSVVWFDWEHCGTRNALDDFAWLLADEYVPELDGLAEIATAHAPEDWDGDRARSYFVTYATFHTAVRLALVVRHKADGAWWDEAICLADDKVRVTAEGARLLCGRGAAFADMDGAVRPLAGWFADVAGRLGVG
ncbi:MAG: phosphotransferase [Alphaproteobacteria bacterium]|nr:phosphotransferase [Alphaproteobacteria bacterium]